MDGHDKYCDTQQPNHGCRFQRLKLFVNLLRGFHLTARFGDNRGGYGSIVRVRRRCTRSTSNVFDSWCFGCPGCWSLRRLRLDEFCDRGNLFRCNPFVFGSARRHDKRTATNRPFLDQRHKLGFCHGPSRAIRSLLFE